MWWCDADFFYGFASTGCNNVKEPCLQHVYNLDAYVDNLDACALYTSLLHAGMCGMSKVTIVPAFVLTCKRFYDMFLSSGYDWRHVRTWV